jgi:hypothetical protein
MATDTASQSRRKLLVDGRIPLTTIDRIVSENLGPARVRSRAQPEALFRQIAMYLAKHVGGWSTTRIGKFYNGRDHSTVCHAIARVQELRNADAEMDVLIQSPAEACEGEGTTGPSRPATAAETLKDVMVRRIETDLDTLADRIADRILFRLNGCAGRAGEIPSDQEQKPVRAGRASWPDGALLAARSTRTE